MILFRAKCSVVSHRDAFAGHFRRVEIQLEFTKKSLNTLNHPFKSCGDTNFCFSINWERGSVVNSQSHLNHHHHLTKARWGSGWLKTHSGCWDIWYNYALYEITASTPSWHEDYEWWHSNKWVDVVRFEVLMIHWP